MRRRTVGAVLAGGRATRLGAPKPAVALAGRPLIDYPLATLAGAGIEPMVVAKPDSELPEVGCRIVREQPEPMHPLTGLVAALEAAGEGAVIVLACDMPFVPAELVAWLADLPDSVAVTFAGGRVHPLLGRYAAQTVRLFQPALADPMPMTEAAISLDPRIVTEAELRQFGEPELITFNVNTAEDLEWAEHRLRS